ncbi:gamma-glutamyltransferase [Natrialba asiatica]|uniref:Gamma-glutamyltranspeptidase n=1 Tax=Natrialba asiatica (strain ATCC 700177 / DSM 12278 / JCM 9576 / FERM P-10747 / NBRC 102637 / 172P1) TaxID=29540 RepID=M0AWU0_NATA1|nr:gamma-glutamyltransferase [Natrialba asiatica]ELZ02438.1 gamma-glutamyltranspeptidase [Natrialba asiatica DSM 12278]
MTNDQPSRGVETGEDRDSATADKIDRQATRRGSLSRRSLLARTGIAAGALAAGPAAIPAAADATDVTDVPGFSCDKRHFRCGRQVTAAGGMVSSVDPIASGVAATILREGGNAIDAAIALQYVLTVTQPHGSGIGGGGFMVIYDAADDEFSVVNSRERAPHGATADMFLDEDGDPIPFDARVQMGEAVGVPGTVSGLETARERHGSRPRQRLITPAIKLAWNGFSIDEFLAAQIESNWEKFNDAAREAYSDENGEPLSAGDTYVNKDLAETLLWIKYLGAAGFYEGPVAADLAATVQEAGGSMTTDDLAAYDAVVEDPVRAEWGDVEIVGQPLPSSGPSAVTMILKLLEELDLGAYDRDSPEAYHLVAEAIRLTWADRNEYMGDPEFVDVPIDGLLDDDYLSGRAAQVSIGETLADYGAGECVDPGVPPGAGDQPAAPASTYFPGSTTHFSVVDADGNAVSYTSTIEQFMGSGMMVPGRGFMLNNELTDFDAVPGGPNEVEPWKRPLSSMSPTMVVRDGVPEFTVGSPGGWTIVSATVQTILHRYVYGLDPLESITEPTIYTGECLDISWDAGVPDHVRETTADWGQVWENSSEMLGNVQAIDIDAGSDDLTGAADPNRNGQAVGLVEMGPWNGAAGGKDDKGGKPE